ncbi:hypothetical protein BKH41_07455 [Helicobacter sp. 12S02232-10]|uniref:CinA family protein n=1 Tax=Helicobacter sp. 12S02232-10 TaxID=1476197 RepID=UPI000BA5D705|nr:CinA family protein [Helicobacter sp. 12S02232-10]PAF47409.1 hypothetical protein BKH41_07455 [Helicobacter sp. 12S02232-10]
MKKFLTFLGIDNEASLILCQHYAEKFDVRMRVENEKILLEGKDTQKVFESIKSVFGDKVIESDNLTASIIDILKKGNKKIATAESCTGGLLAYQFTSVSGVSDVYEGGIVSYSNAIKHKCLGVKTEWLEKYGAVSEPVVRDMLSGALKVFGVDYAIATSGIAGPSGGSLEKPVGTVYIGVQKVGNLAIIERYLFKGGRQKIQKQSCASALEMLAKIL